MLAGRPDTKVIDERHIAASTAFTLGRTSVLMEERRRPHPVDYPLGHHLRKA